MLFYASALIFVFHRVSSASLLYSGALSLLFSLGSSCLFIVFGGR